MNEQKIIFLICSVGLMLQLSKLIEQYVQFNTVVNVDYESSRYKSIPAITICLSKVLSMKRVIEYFQRYNSSSEQSIKVTNAYQLYQAALVNFSTIESNNLTKNDFMNSIYKDYFENLIPNLTIMQIYEMSIPISNESSFVVLGNKLNQDGSTSYLAQEAQKPIESLMLSNFILGKCFTYFSHLEESYRNINIDIYLMELTLVHDETDFPSSLYSYNETFGKIWFAIHSGNTIPQENNEFDVFDQNKYYEYQFNMLKIKLLKSPYKTDCHDYDQSGNF